GSRLGCQTCVADSECQESYRCVGMFFDGEPRESGYCLKPASVGGCQRPFTVPIEGRVSRSGAPAATYCGLSEARTTCEAVLDLLADKSCETADDCGAPGLDDARCETVNFAAKRCTYSCSSSSQCPDE